MKCLTNFIEIFNNSNKPLIFQPKILVCEEDFQAFIPPKSPLNVLGNYLIIDVRPFLNGAINLDDYIFIWGKSRVAIENLCLRTKGECYMNYAIEYNDPMTLKFKTV